ncbi:hypothetical protein Taro_050503 [Colocasia esculenta]|uniref:Uncharacterized protein n=1 Tax=Colocasia esculenta TaxID=4460 RepID=A0A843XE38_COLES|nr:hypothetical protein [Colocasia esculenta]
MKSFQYAMFCLLVLMYFEQLNEKAIGKAQRDLLMFAGKLNVFAFKLLELCKRQRETHLPLIKAAAGLTPRENNFHFSYVDSLLKLELPEENRRKLNEEGIIFLCSEFLNAGTETTSMALQWIMANVVKHQDVQERIADKISTVSREGEEIPPTPRDPVHLHQDPLPPMPAAGLSIVVFPLSNPKVQQQPMELGADGEEMRERERRGSS